MSSSTAPASTRPQPLAVCSAVAVGVVVVEIVLERLQLHLNRWIAPHLPEWSYHLASLVLLELRPAVLAVVLLIWARTAVGRVAAPLVALSFGAVQWFVLDIYLRHRTPGQGELRVIDWTLSLLLPTLIALSWGLARRRGRLWPFGLVVAPLLAGIRVSLTEQSDWFTTWFFDLPWLAQALILLIPPIAACLACWLIEEQEARTQTSARPYDEERADVW